MACRIDEADECNGLTQKDTILDVGFIMTRIAKRVKYIKRELTYLLQQLLTIRSSTPRPRFRF